MTKTKLLIGWIFLFYVLTERYRYCAAVGYAWPQIHNDKLSRNNNKKGFRGANFFSYTLFSLFDFLSSCSFFNPIHTHSNLFAKKHPNLKDSDKQLEKSRSELKQNKTCSFRDLPILLKVNFVYRSGIFCSIYSLFRYEKSLKYVPTHSKHKTVKNIA